MPNGKNGDDRPMAWRYAGDQMKLWRETAGLTRQKLADEAGYGYDAIKCMERGVRKPQPRVLRLADELCGAKGKLAAAEEFLKPEPFPTYSHDYMHAEGDAVAHSSYQNEFIPGLLQTERYARALLAAHCPPLDDETIEERVRARLERRTLLEKQTKAFSFVVEEGALRNPVVSADGRKQQLFHILDVGKPRNITIQMMPENSGYHPGLLGPFVLLETPEHGYLGYEEGQTTGVLYEDSKKISILRQRHEMILRQALNPEESAAFIRKLAEEL